MQEQKIAIDYLGTEDKVTSAPVKSDSGTINIKR
jgi:hypothetical protein